MATNSKKFLSREIERATLVAEAGMRWAEETIRVCEQARYYRSLGEWDVANDLLLDLRRRKRESSYGRTQQVYVHRQPNQRPGTTPDADG